MRCFIIILLCQSASRSARIPSSSLDLAQRSAQMAKASARDINDQSAAATIIGQMISMSCHNLQGRAIHAQDQ
ncbi:hypothetical protein SCHPADRAFT_11535 [Schizopora paradoxa]|uniref:Secreted protein n=1 Tax=Schizopora paradoxa TaxID=27342 RepID=A0A0H2STU9_9AGAM|nr:hypothetical protein SCHPADRAFT_11535 [Schizopora paradoxa]